MRKPILIILLILCVSGVKSQVSLSYRPGYGTYMFTNLRQFQEDILSESEFPAEIVTQFPGYINHKIFVGFPSLSGGNGLFLGYVTTGGRISLTDYSGKWLFDMELNGFKAGYHKEFPAKESGNFSINTYLDFGTTLTYMNMIEYLKIGDEEVEESYLFIGHGIDIEPGVTAMIKRKAFNIGIFVGYELSLSLPFYQKGAFQGEIDHTFRSVGQSQLVGIKDRDTD
ncbi:MAG: hypothetical protein IPH20_09045 [Bacteroidales bacterium]|nr:hypothetical protein [Bacteroidales bacterium]